VISQCRGIPIRLNAKQGTQIGSHFGEDISWSFSRKLRATGSPVSALQMVRKNNTGYRQSLRQLDFERVTFRLSGNRTHEREVCSAVVGHR
jgi:hypothetical protein